MRSPRAAEKLRRMPLLRGLALATRHIEARLDERLRSLGLGTSEAWFLLVLLEAGQAHTTALARALGVTFSTMTQLVDRLEGRGWVRRQRDPLDRRAITLRLSPAGRQRALAVSRCLAALERKLSREIARRRRELFGQMLDTVLKVVQS